MKTQLPFFTFLNIPLPNVSYIPVQIISAEKLTFINKISVCNTSLTKIRITLKRITYANLPNPIEIVKLDSYLIDPKSTVNLLNIIDESTLILNDLDTLVINTYDYSQKCDVDVDVLISNENSQ